MDRNFKLFMQCVISLRTAEKEYEKESTAFNKNVMENVQNKVDGWIKWYHEKEEGNTDSSVPPFIGKTASSANYQGAISSDIIAKLKENHTPEEIDRFVSLMQSNK